MGGWIDRWIRVRQYHLTYYYLTFSSLCIHHLPFTHFFFLRTAFCPQSAQHPIFLAPLSPSTSGTCVATPSSGNALTTVFLLTSPGWTTDASNFPLSYAYAYQVSPGGSFLSISALRYTLTTTFPPFTETNHGFPTVTSINNFFSSSWFSLSATSSTTLPSGLSTYQFQVTVQSQAVDVYLSGAVASVGVPVQLSAKTNVTRVLSSSLSTAFTSGNINLAFQTVNNVATSVNAIDCSGAPNCTALHRVRCLTTPNTCGSCLPNYNGVIGDYNLACSPSGSSGPASSPTTAGASIGNPGVACKSASDCLYGLCTNGICVAPPLLCPSALSTATCSGNGKCTYTDPSGNPLVSCTILNSACVATCICNVGYGA